LGITDVIGGCYCAGTNKNKKVIEIFPLVFGSAGSGIKFILENILSGKLVTLKLIFVLTSHNIEELFKNSVGKIGAKILQKGNFYFPHPFFRLTVPKCTPL
jgi:hypothetical protein